MKVVAYRNDHSGLIEHEVIMHSPTESMTLEMLVSAYAHLGAIIVEQDDLPSHIYFPAWELNGGEIVVNLEKAKEVAKIRIRAERNHALLALDVAFQRALETNADTSAIVKDKQRLRDLPKLADSAKSLEELSGIHP